MSIELSSDQGAARFNWLRLGQPASKIHCSCCLLQLHPQKNKIAEASTLICSSSDEMGHGFLPVITCKKYYIQITDRW